MKKYFITFSFIALMTFSGWSPNNRGTDITIEDEKITVDEFLSVFNKNNPENDNSKEALESVKNIITQF